MDWHEPQPLARPCLPAPHP